MAEVAKGLQTTQTAVLAPGHTGALNLNIGLSDPAHRPFKPCV